MFRSWVLLQNDQQIRLTAVERDTPLARGDLVDDGGEWKIAKVFEGEEDRILYEILASFSPNKIQPLFDISLN